MNERSIRKIIITLGMISILSCASLPSSNDMGNDPDRDLASNEKESEDSSRIRSNAKHLLDSFITLGRVENIERPKPQPQLPHIFPRKFSRSEISSCFESTCGRAAKNWSLSQVTQRPGVDLAVQQKWDSEFQPWLKALAKADLEVQTQFIDQIDEILKSKVTVEQGQPFQAIYTLTRLFNKMSDRIGDVFEFNSQWNYARIKQREFIKVIDSLDSDEKTAASLILRRFVLPIFHLSAQAQHNPLANLQTARLLSRFPGLNLKEAQKRDADQLLLSVQTNQKKIGERIWSLMMSESEWTMLQAAQSGRDLTKTESTIYVTAALKIELYADVFNDVTYLNTLMAVPVDFEPLLAKFRNNQERSSIFNVVDAQSFSARVTNLSKYCQVKFRSALALNASDFRYQRVPPMIEKIKTAAKRTVGNFIDREQLNGFEATIDQIEFSLPTSNAVRIEELRQAFLKKEQHFKTVRGIMSSRDAESDQTILAIAIVWALSPKTQDSSHFGDLTEIKEACEQMPEDTVTDFALSSLGKISMSWYSANYPEVGAAIIAHEIGHVVSAEIRRQQTLGIPHTAFSNSLTCVANRNPYVVTPKDLSQFGNSPWSEEDWADHFSARVMIDFEKSESLGFQVSNLGCALVSVQNRSYSNAKLEPTPNDTHSSPLLRLLMTGHDRGRLSPKCKSFLTYASEAGRNLTCP